MTGTMLLDDQLAHVSTGLLGRSFSRKLSLRFSVLFICKPAGRYASEALNPTCNKVSAASFEHFCQIKKQENLSEELLPEKMKRLLLSVSY